MSRFCIVVCFLAFAALVQSRHYVKYSYEELEEDEEKTSVPMMKLMKPLNVLRFQQVSGLTSFHWDNCGKTSKVITISHFAITPDPVKAGGSVKVAVQGTMDETVNSPIEAKLQPTFNNVPVPCSFIGSCDISDICAQLPTRTCPLKKGKFNLDKSFRVGQGLPSGDYGVTVDFMSKGTWLACFHVTVSISN